MLGIPNISSRESSCNRLSIVFTNLGSLEGSFENLRAAETELVVVKVAQYGKILMSHIYEIEKKSVFNTITCEK